MSRTIHTIGDWTARGGTSAAVIALVGAFWVVLAATGFRTSWQVTFASVSASITLVMVFAIQHTQRREHVTTQLKLDELIRSSPRASDLFIHIEKSHDDELREREQEQVELHGSLRDD